MPPRRKHKAKASLIAFGLIVVATLASGTAIEVCSHHYILPMSPTYVVECCIG